MKRFVLALMVISAALLTSCDDSAKAKACADKQADYESDYIMQTGTTDGMDVNKYSMVDGECVTDQGVEG